MPGKNAFGGKGMKTLLVVGASSDVGSALINHVANLYDVVWAHYWHWNGKLEEIKTAFGDKIHFIQADLTNAIDIEALISEIKGSGHEPDHVVHFPMAKVFTQKFLKADWADFEAGWKMAVQSSVTLLQAFLPAMVKKKNGKIVFMLSSYTLDTPPKFESAYVTVKYAMLGLMKSLAAEYADKGIAINGVSPDMIQTKFISDLPHLLVEQYAQSRPSKRILTVDEVIPTISFLLSDGANCITGENIRIQ